LGVVGLYTLSYDEKEAYWLGWYCVNNNARGKGVGKALLGFAIRKVNKDGKKYLRPYTFNEPNERKANRIYDKLGFKSMTKKKLHRLVTSKRFRNYIKKYIYKELKLK